MPYVIPHTTYHNGTHTSVLVNIKLELYFDYNTHCLVSLAELECSNEKNLQGVYVVETKRGTACYARACVSSPTLSVHVSSLCYL